MHLAKLLLLVYISKPLPSSFPTLFANMASSQTFTALRCQDAPQLNQELMVEFQAALNSDPAADLLSIFSARYRLEHENAQSTKLSKVGKINLQQLDELYEQFRDDPEIDLTTAIPKWYSRQRTFARPAPPAPEIPPTESDFREKLDIQETANVVFPLSTSVWSLLAGRESYSPAEMEEGQLLSSLKTLIWRSPKLWECPIRGVVVKCSDDIVAKVLNTKKDYTEYTTMQYLAQHAADIPAPRTHGLIAVGHCHVIFMSLVPGTTLSNAWPRLSGQQKLAVQQQLDGIFVRLRSIAKPEGQTLGGVCGEGVKELRVNECALFPGIDTAAQYRELQLSARHYGSNTYVKFLHSFLEAGKSSTTDKVVFTHGDVRMDNIMVDTILGTDDVMITGVIDWGDSGFYPEWYECMALTRTLSMLDENDWYLYLPNSISPQKYPTQWLVDRLWGRHLRDF